MNGKLTGRARPNCRGLDKPGGMCYHRFCVKRNDRDSTRKFRYDREKVHRLKGLPKETFVNSLLSSLCERNSSSAGREVPLQTLECRIGIMRNLGGTTESQLRPIARDGAFFMLTVQPCDDFFWERCCKLACISLFQEKSSYGERPVLLVFA